MGKSEKRTDQASRGEPLVVWYGEALPGGSDARQLLGEKGQTLHAMAQAGLPVPPFFVVTTRAKVSAAGMDELLQVEIRRGLQKLEEATGKGLGDESRPLLLAVRASAVDAPAGLLPGALNLGFNARIARALLARTADERFVYDSYRRGIQQLAQLAHHVDAIHFEREVRSELTNRALAGEADLDGGSMCELTRRFLDLYAMRTGGEFPAETYKQLNLALMAALLSGEQPLVRMHHQRGGGEGALAMAVIVQAMVFGNRANQSLAGVAFTRNPLNGADELTGEYAPCAQGDDLGHGRRRTLPLSHLQKTEEQVFAQLEGIKKILEKRFREAQEFAFTVEQGRVSVLQARLASRSAEAAVRIAVELSQQELMTPREAVASIEPEIIEQLLHARFDLREKPQPLTQGSPAAPGAVSGKIAFSAEEAQRRAAQGEKIILVRRETDATDVIGMQQCEGILTSSGGMTSHAAVVARGMGKCCIVGAAEIEIDEKRLRMRVGKRMLGEEDVISLDGNSGEVFYGAVAKVEGKLRPTMKKLLQWADELRVLQVYANVDAPRDAQLAVELGAQGVGLCRTEHMFFAPRRIMHMRKMILAGPEDTATRRGALQTLLAYQREDFAGIFRAMAGRPVVVRLLDPPLHEFLPHALQDQRELAKELGLSLREVQQRTRQMSETNPMLGHRGCRLAVSYPEILQMQVRAILEAAMVCMEEKVEARPQILIPLTISGRELQRLVAQVRQVADQVMREMGMLVHYEVGTMIETPRAALVAGELAACAQFFSFGTNDLTQTTLAISRDDAAIFLGEYEKLKLFPADPFRKLDREGVGELMRLAMRSGRGQREDLRVGVCGEHAAEEDSIAFFHKLGVDYISCSPLRLPVARLAAAHAAIAGG